MKVMNTDSISRALAGRFDGAQIVRLHFLLKVRRTVIVIIGGRRALIKCPRKYEAGKQVRPDFMVVEQGEKVGRLWRIMDQKTFGLADEWDELEAYLDETEDWMRG